jgi:porin
MNEFAHGLGEDQFMNLALITNPIAMWTVPYSGLGAGAIIIPNENILWVFSAIDKEGEANKSGFDTVFKDGTTLASEIRFTTNLFERPGHILLGGTWCNEVTGFEDRLLVPRTSQPFSSMFFVDAESYFLLRAFNVLRRLPRLNEKESWSLYMNFDQYLYVEDADSKQGVGLFGRFGLSDGDPNILHRFYSIGLGGKGIIPGRDNDRFGLGYFYADVSDNLPYILSSAGDGKGVELFYNIEVTPWLHITPDVQVLMPGSPDLDTTWVLGLRAKVDF